MKELFIVGNSRSGTSMMSRIVGKHPMVYAFPYELHFFEEQWDPVQENNPLERNNAIQLLSWLLCVSTEGYLREMEKNNHPK